MPVREIESLAHACAVRAFLFTVLAILMTMLGLSFQPSMALSVGSGLFLVASLGFLVQARSLDRVPVRRTAVWAALPPERRPRDTGLAQRLIVMAHRRAFERFAHRAAATAAVLAGLALGVMASWRLLGL